MELNMKILLLCSFVILLNSASAQQNAANKSIVCYFTSWSVYRPGNGSFRVRDIDPTLCTHINYVALGLNENGTIQIRDPWEALPSGLNSFVQLVELKEISPDVKIIMTIGGLAEYTQAFSTIASNETLRNTFADNIVAFLAQHKFDGIDIDWPSDGSNPDDKDAFTELLTVINSVVRSKGYIVSLAPSGNPHTAAALYNVSAISPLVDLINVKTYDYHGYWDGYVGHYAPLYTAAEDQGIDAQRNGDAGIQFWLKNGADPKKMNFAITTISRTFTLADPKNASLYAPITGGGNPGPYTGEEGLLSHVELCEFYRKENDWVMYWNDDQKVPYATYNGTQWAGFETNVSIYAKLDYVTNNTIGGVALYALDFDDFKGTCGSKYHNLGMINEYFNS